MVTIGISGGSGSGKSTVVAELIRRLPKGTITVIPQDAYYHDNGTRTPEEKRQINFDHPDAIEWNLLIDQINRLKQHREIEMPIYSYVTCARSEQTVHVIPRSILLVEGILVLTNEELRKLLDIKVFVDADADERLMRIIRRDMQERGRSLDQGLRHYETFVKPMHLQFIEPSKRFADIIIPQGGENVIAIDMLHALVRMASTGSSRDAE